MQQRIGDGDIADIGCRVFHVVHQPGQFINADVRLHPEVPLVALAGLMHFRVTCLGGVLGRARRVDDRGIHDRACAQALAFARKVRIHRLQAMLLQQTTEGEDRGLILDYRAR